MQILQTTFHSPLGQQAAALRVAVFVDEQKVPPDLEIDEHDPTAVHLVTLDAGQVIATLRIVDCQLEGRRVAKIGRVAVAANLRGQGIGRTLMLAALHHARQAAFTEAYLTAQVPVIPFYERLGFTAHGPIFDDCGIPHRAMTLALLPSFPQTNSGTLPPQ